MLSAQSCRMGVAAVFVVFCLMIVSVTSNENDFNGLVSSYSPGVIQDVWHLSDFPAITEDGYFLNEILQPPISDQLTSVFPMPYEVQALLERSTSFSMRILNSSLNDLANTNVFHKGEQLYVQVSASPGPGQQIYIQSCHASSSPNPADKPEVALIINRGCVASKKSLVKFVHRRSDRVILVLGTSSLKSSEVYLHCRVSLSLLGLTSNTKFCNYNKLKSRWVDLSGQTAVCQCCDRSCRSLSEREDLLALSAIVSTGPLIIEDQQSEPQSTPLAPSDYSTTKSSPSARIISDKSWIMAGASFSGSSMENMDNGSPWPVQPGFGGGVMVINQGLGGAFSMWLPDLMELQLNPLVEVGIGFPKNPAVAGVTLQNDDPFRGQKPEETSEEWQLEQDHVEKSQEQDVEMDEGKANFEAVDLQDLGMWPLEDVAHLYKVQRKPFITENVQLEQPEMNKPSQISDFPPSNDVSLFFGTSPSPDKVTNSTEDEDEVVLRQAEMVFKWGKDDKLSEPLLYSKLSLNQATDGSSSLHYEEQKGSNMRKQGIRTLEKEGERSQKDKMEKVFSVKDLVSFLLDRLRGLWMV